MAELEKNINRVNDKLQQLLRQYRQLQKDNERQTKLIAALQQEKKASAEHIVSLQQQVLILRAAATDIDVQDKKEFERLIDQYIREIDKCIALLSE